jgi:rod shape-determining protein MreD
MLKKSLILVLIFCFFALLQNSFFTHFNLFGATPNLVFILFFLLVFFEKKDSSFLIVFTAVLAGFLLDIYSSAYLGPSIVLLIIIGLLSKGIQSLLKNKGDNHPFAYFLPLFIVFLLAYDLLIDLCLYFLGQNKIIISFGVETIFAIIYNIIIASAFFYIYKKLLRNLADGKNLQN